MDLHSKMTMYVTSTMTSPVTKVGWPLDVAWQNSTLQIFICFHHFFVPFEKNASWILGQIVKFLNYLKCM